MFSFFTSVFWVFSLLIAFFHVTDFLYPDCFLLLFCQVLRFCVAVPRVLRVWESFFYPQVFFTLHSFPIFATILQVLWISYRFFYHQAFFTLHSFSTFGTTWCCTNLLSRVLWELAVLLWSCRSIALTTCMFESHSVHQKVLLGRFYLCVEALRNTISTSFRFWTYSLIASYGDSCISYPLGHWSL